MLSSRNPAGQSSWLMGLPESEDDITIHINSKAHIQSPNETAVDFDVLVQNLQSGSVTGSKLNLASNKDWYVTVYSVAFPNNVESFYALDSASNRSTAFAILQVASADADGKKIFGPSPSELPDRDWRSDPADGLRPLIKVRESFNG